MIGNPNEGTSNPVTANHEDESAPKPEQLRALADPLRRRTMDLLDRSESRVSLSELVDRLASSDDRSGQFGGAEESQRDGEPRGRDQLALVLHHVHLPQLADAKLVAYDPCENVVAATPPSWIESYLALAGGANR